MSKGPHPLIRIFVYPVIAITFLVFFYFLSLAASGYKIEYKNGKILKTATGMIVVASKPGDAKVYIDGKPEKRNTPLFSFLNLTVKNMSVGSHDVRIEKDGYESWVSNFEVKPKLVTWAEYVVLVPKDRKSVDYNLPGTLIDIVTTDDKSKIIAAAEDKETMFRTYWEVNLQTKEKTKIREEKILPNEKVDILLYNFDASRFLVNKTVGDVSSNIVYETKIDGKSYDITTLFQMNFDKLSFSPNVKNELFVLKNKNLYNLDYDKKVMSAVLASKVVDLYTNNTSVYLIKETEGNVGLWKILNQKITSVVKVMPVSESYNFKHLKNSDTFLVLSEKDKELLIYQKDTNGNPISRSIARDVINFSLSPKENRIMLFTNSGLRVYDIEKSTYTTTLKDVLPESAIWLNDEYNIVYTFEGKAFLVTFDGQYSKYLFNHVKGTPIYSANFSPNIYFQKLKEPVTDLSIYNFDF